MMSEENSQLVKSVYSHFLKTEEDGWSELDDNLEFFDWLTDRELVVECEVKREKFGKGVRCQIDHDQRECLAGTIFDATCAILDLYKQTQYLPVMNRYILNYFIAMCEMQLISAA